LNSLKKDSEDNELAAAILKSKEDAAILMDRMVKDVKNRFRVK